MSQTTITSAPYQNSNLFTNHYLQHRVQQLDGWKVDDEAREAFEELQALYEVEKDSVETYKEKNLVKHWIDEVLEVLGFDMLGETALTEESGNVDRLLFESANERREAVRRKRDDDIAGAYNLSLALLEAKTWDTEFDASYAGDRKYRNASHQTIHYLENTPNSVQWGILTDGRKWRLYSVSDRDTKTHYQIDLPELLVKGDLEEFRYFYSFFRADAFREVGNRSYLETVRDESDVASREIGEELQDNVFTALRVLGKGFVETNDLDIGPDDEEELSRLKRQSLVYLYRLMFLLHAEGHGLISPDSPQAQKEYAKNFSIDRIRRGIIEEVDNSTFDDEYSTYTNTLNSRLEKLFDLVDTGNEELGIPPYNGGLFNPDKHEFLADYEVADRYLAEVIYRLSTVEDGDEVFRVDYSTDLDTRHLGSVYEGLLEHQFKIADADLAAVNGGDEQVWKPLDEVSEDSIVESVPSGGLYVTTDSGKRKATGSYYTPDYIVEYIIKDTIDPLLEEAREEAAEEASPGSAEFAERFAERVLDSRIVDPAMGSGHFLIGAMEHLADEVQSEFRSADGVDYDDDDVDQFKRKIAKECIYGVDRNEMAVELAKVALWLETLASDQPLAFLDHHLKHGDSLVGTNIERIDALDTTNGDDEQTSMFEFGDTQRTVVQRLMDIYEDFLAIENEDLEDVKEMERKYRQIRLDELRQRLVAVANVHTAKFLGVDVPSGAFEQLSDAVDDDQEWSEVVDEDWFSPAQKAAKQHSAFHWRLEFPEVFYTKEGRPQSSLGFDAVLSNPPYIRIQHLRQEQPAVADYLKAEGRYATTEARFDIYAPFVEQGVRLAADDRVSYILPNKFFKSDGGEALRRCLSDQNLVSRIVDFGNHQIFDDAITYTCILSLEAGSEQFDYVRAYEGVNDAKELRDLSEVCMDSDEIDNEPWILTGPKEKRVLDKMKKAKNTVGDISEYTSQGLVSGDNGVFFVEIDEIGEEVATVRSAANDTQYEIESDMVHPIIDGDDVSRYDPPKTNLGVIYPYESGSGGVRLIPETRLESEHPLTYDYLDDFRERLADRGSESMDYPAWYALWRPREKQLWERPKLLHPRIVERSEFTLDDDGGLYLHDSGYGIVPANNTHPVRAFLLALLNSSTTWFYLYWTSPVIENDFRQPLAKYLSPIPLPKIEPEEDPRNLEDCFDELVAEFVQTGQVPEVEQKAAFLAHLSQRLMKLHEQHSSINLSIQDYLGSYAEGPTLTEVDDYQPAPDVHESILPKTEKTRNGLRFDRLDTRWEGDTLVVTATARYKPEDAADYETDSNGFTQTKPVPAMEFPRVSEELAVLIEEFLELVNEKDDGFAGFYEQARKTISLLDRLEDITLPAQEDVSDGLKRYVEKKERAANLDQRIERLERLVDRLVYQLYGFNEDEIETIEAVAGGD